MSERSDRRRLLAGMGVVAGSMFAPKAIAGVLEPPGGAPGPTGIALDAVALRASRPGGVANPCTAVESLGGSASAQRVISAPGSYYLTQNLVGVNGQHGIAILTNDVDLDLCGFHILGPSGPPGTVNGVGIYVEGENVTVYDGSARGFARGFDFEHATRFIVWDVTSVGASLEGVVLGSFGECYDTDVHGAGVSGIMCAGQGALVHECGVWNTPLGFGTLPAGASKNFLLGNCACQCTTPYALGGNSFGPIVTAGAGDISGIPGGNHPAANFAF